MTRRRLRMILGRDDPWINICRQGSTPDGDDLWPYIAWGIAIVVLLAWLFS